jgi:hypothetical protein
MKFSSVQRIGGLVLACCLVANFSFAQQKQEQKSETSPKKIIIIKKEENGKVTTEKIVVDGEELQNINLNGKDGQIMVKEIDGDGQRQIKVMVNPTEGDLHREQNVNVEVEEINGEKQIKVRVQPQDGDLKTFEWKGKGEIPADLKEKLEADGIFIHEMGTENLDGENVFILKGEDAGNFAWNSREEAGGPFLGVVNAMETKVTVVVDENGEKRTTETKGEEETVEGIKIGEVVAGSAAAEAGLKAGDILKSIDSEPLEDFSDLVEFMKEAEVGQTISLSYERDGQLLETQATLQERKEGMGQNIIIERILEDGEDMDKTGNSFFFRTEEGDGAKIHTRHNVVVITRTDDSDEAEEEGEMEFSEETLPEVALKRDLALSAYKLFPNPADGKVRLQFQADAVPTVIKISDLNGKQMYRERFNQFDGTYDQNIDLSDLPAGSFFLTIEQAGKVYTEQLILK